MQVVFAKTGIFIFATKISGILIVHALFRVCGFSNLAKICLLIRIKQYNLLKTLKKVDAVHPIFPN